MARRKRKEGIIRRSLELHPRTAKRLDRLRDAMEATSDTEVFRRALEVFEALLESEGDGGGKLYIKDKDGVFTRVTLRYTGISNEAANIMQRRPSL